MDDESTTPDPEPEAPEPEAPSEAPEPSDADAPPIEYPEDAKGGASEGGAEAAKE